MASRVGIGNGSAREPQAAAPAGTTDPAAPSPDRRIDALLVGERWSGPAITYSDPDRPGDYGPAYPADDDGDGRSAPQDGFSPLTAAQLMAVHAALNADDLGQAPGYAGFSVEGVTRLDIAYAGPGSADGILRFANTRDVAPPDTAYAYYPNPSAFGGDAWFEEAGRQPVAGNYDSLTILHETGHTLGLRHGHEFPRPLPAAYDSVEFTVMTYRSFVGAPVDYYHVGAVDFPQSYMMLDIAALQHLYGADFATRAGDTTYSWSPSTGRTFVDGQLAVAPAGNRVFLTVWDGGGIDTYDLSAYRTDLTLDLRPGQHSILDPRQLADLGGGPNGGHARGNLFNALQHRGDPRSLIENARGGSGDDRITGNDAANRLDGNAGADRLLARGGADRLTGGAGDDMLRGGRGADIQIGGAGHDWFDFDAALDSPGAGGQDVLRAGAGGAAFGGPGLARGDLIDVSGIDALTSRSGNQAFTYGGTGAGTLCLRESGATTLVCADTGGSKAFDFVLRIADGATEAADYVHEDFLL